MLYSNKGESFTIEDYEILKKTIFGEGRYQSRRGQRAIAWVIYNRWKTDPSKWGCSIADVCTKRGQFECWLDGNKLDQAISKEAAVFNTMDEWLPWVYVDPQFPDPTSGADHCCHILIPDNKEDKINSSVIHDRRLQIGDHLFYKEKNNII